MENEESLKKNQEHQTASGTPSGSLVSEEQLQTQLVNLLGYQAKADQEIAKSEQFRSESVTRLDRIEAEQRNTQAGLARLEAILRVLVGAPKGDLDKALQGGPIPVKYKGSDGKAKEFLLEKLRLIP